MLINDPNSHRTLTFEGVGSEWEVEDIENLKRFDEESGELLERDEWEYETLGSDEINGGVEYEHLRIYLKNNDTGEKECLNETKTFEELGITVIGLKECLEEMDKEGEKVSETVDDSKLSDDDYFYFKSENFKGVWGEKDFDNGEYFHLDLITLYVTRENGENQVKINYDMEDLEGYELNGGGSIGEIRSIED